MQRNISSDIFKPVIVRIGNNALVSKSLKEDDEPAVRSLSQDGTGRMNGQCSGESIVRPDLWACGTVNLGK